MGLRESKQQDSLDLATTRTPTIEKKQQQEEEGGGQGTEGQKLEDARRETQEAQRNAHQLTSSSSEDFAAWMVSRCPSDEEAAVKEGAASVASTVLEEGAEQSEGEKKDLVSRADIAADDTTDVGESKKSVTVESPGTGTQRSEASLRFSDRGHASESSGRGSHGFTTRVSMTSSARSSFALEQADTSVNRKSLEMFLGHVSADETLVGSAPTTGTLERLSLDEPDSESLHLAAFQEVIQEQEDVYDVFDQVEQAIVRTGVPKDLWQEVCVLAVLPADTPAPLSMLKQLWARRSERDQDAESVLVRLAHTGIVKAARFPDGMLWGLPKSNVLKRIHSTILPENVLASFHRYVVKSYGRSASEEGEHASLAKVDDDGYIVSNLCHHLIAGRMDNTAREMLIDPDWLERKLRVCSAAAVVNDFRRYLMFHVHDSDIKLVLEAFQMSIGVLTKNPVHGLVRSQLVGRLLVAPLSAQGKDWLRKQQDLQAVTLAAQSESIIPISALNPCLDQAGGLQRLCLKGHRGPVTHVYILQVGTEAITASADGTMRVWDLEIGDCTLEIQAHQGPITDMRVTADGSLVVSSSEDGTMRAFELERGRCLRTVGVGGGMPLERMVLDPFGRFTITSNAEGVICMWDLGSAAPMHKFVTHARVTCMELSPCSEYVVLGTIDGLVLAIEIASWKLVSKLEGHTGAITCLHVTHQLRRILSASEDGRVKLWEGNRLKRDMENLGGSVNCMHVIKSGKRVICGCEDGKARVWDISRGSCVSVLDGHMGAIRAVTMSPYEEKVVTASSDGTSIAWKTDSGEILRVLEGHSGGILCLEVTRRGRFGVTGSEDGSVRVWDFSAVYSHIPHWHSGSIRTVSTGNGVAVATAGDDSIAHLWDITKEEFLGSLRKHTVSIRWSKISGDGTRLLTASPNRQVSVWDIAEQKFLYGLPAHQGSRIKCISATDDLKLAVICLFDSTVTLWNVETQEIVRCLQKWGQRDASVGHTSAVNELVMTKDGSHVITASKDSTLRVWDVRTGECLHVLEEHMDSVVGLHLEEASNLLASYSLDQSLVTWDFQRGEKLSRVKFKQRIKLVALSSDRKIAAALEDGSISVVLPQKHQVKEIRMHSDEVTHLSFTEDGRYLISASRDCSLRVVDLIQERVCAIFVGDCGFTCFSLHHPTQHIVAGTDRGVVSFLDISVLPC
ncbi:hypothetical protein M9434_002106 [Picochlorum sp. BPE23]|nr:hypothetical protein M9434_002106 [Picochlorum sp. BPE23]